MSQLYFGDRLDKLGTLGARKTTQDGKKLIQVTFTEGDETLKLWYLWSDIMERVEDAQRDAEHQAYLNHLYRTTYGGGAGPNHLPSKVYFQFQKTGNKLVPGILGRRGKGTIQVTFEGYKTMWYPRDEVIWWANINNNIDWIRWERQQENEDRAETARCRSLAQRQASP